MIREICSKLKDKRKELGYSIEQVVEKTKLHPTVIKDIENCNLGNIDSVYIKGFMKIYASFLGVYLGSALDEIQPATQQKKKEIKPKKKNDNGLYKRISGLIKKITPDIRKRILTIAVILIIIWSVFNGLKFIIGGIARVFKGKKSETTQVQTIDPTEPVIVDVSDGISASLTAKKKCFVKVVVDKKVLFEGVLAKGAIETWNARKEIEFKISDGSAVHLEVNGKAIPTLTSIRKPIKSLKITSSGITVDK